MLYNIYCTNNSYDVFRRDGQIWPADVACFSGKAITHTSTCVEYTYMPLQREQCLRNKITPTPNLYRRPV